MIFQWILNALAAILSAILSVLPDWDLPTNDWVGALTWVGRSASLFSNYWPLTATAVCVGIVITVRICLSCWQAILFAYHQVWGSS